MLLAVTVVVSMVVHASDVWVRAAVVLAVASAASAVTGRVGAIAALCLLVPVVMWWGSRAWHEVGEARLGDWDGWATVMADPRPLGRAVSVTVELDHQRFDAVAYGGVGRKLGQLTTGERVQLVGTRRALRETAARRAAVRHVVGRVDVEFVGDRVPGRMVWVAADRVRSALRAVAEDAMSTDEAALFAGLVVGDDARQSPAMVDRFRASGLSHLTAASGQNLAFITAAAMPLLRRLGARARWCAVVGLVGWFMVLTRFEPSVLRAGVMAVLVAAGTLTGRAIPVVRVLAVTVTVLAIVDPLLVWSVGFWLSVSATVGVTVVAPVLARALPGPGWLASALGVTLGAQIGVALPSLLVFGRLPVVSLVANPAAVPVAGAVMLVGLPSALLATALPSPAARLVMQPARIGTRWVDQVARLAEHLEPAPPVSMALWIVAMVTMVVLLARRQRLARHTDVPI